MKGRARVTIVSPLPECSWFPPVITSSGRIPWWKPASLLYLHLLSFSCGLSCPPVCCWLLVLLGRRFSQPVWRPERRLRLRSTTHSRSVFPSLLNTREKSVFSAAADYSLTNVSLVSVPIHPSSSTKVRVFRTRLLFLILPSESPHLKEKRKAKWASEELKTQTTNLWTGNRRNVPLWTRWRSSGFQPRWRIWNDWKREQKVKLSFFSFADFSKNKQTNKEKNEWCGKQQLAIFIAAVWLRLLNPAPLFLLRFFLLAVRLHSFGFATRGRNSV